MTDNIGMPTAKVSQSDCNNDGQYEMSICMPRWYLLPFPVDNRCQNRLASLICFAVVNNLMFAIGILMLSVVVPDIAVVLWFGGDIAVSVISH